MWFAVQTIKYLCFYTNLKHSTGTEVFAQPSAFDLRSADSQLSLQLRWRLRKSGTTVANNRRFISNKRRNGHT